MFSVQSVNSIRSALLRSTKCLPAVQNAVAKMSTSSDPKEPSFTEMCEGFFESARTYVEHRLLTKPDPPGYRPEKFEDKKHRIKGKLAQEFVIPCKLLTVINNLFCLSAFRRRLDYVTLLLHRFSCTKRHL